MLRDSLVCCNFREDTIEISLKIAVKRRSGQELLTELVARPPVPPPPAPAEPQPEAPPEAPEPEQPVLKVKTPKKRVVCSLYN